jgi:hypothetical protein
LSFLVDRKDILEWSDEVRAGYELPRILRSLIAHDNNSIKSLTMPAAEGARLSGYDGDVEAAASSALVPAGRSVWELGVAARPGVKANSDYKKRTDDPGLVVPADTTYVAVTSRSWPKRAQWVEGRKAEGVWKDVKAYDVEELSAALDRDTASAILFRDLSNRRAGQATTLECWWTGYSTLFTLPLTPEFVLAGRTAQKGQLDAWRAAGQPVIEVRAQSHEDGQAFVASALGVAAGGSSDLVVCDDLATARELIARSRGPLVLVTTIEPAELMPLGLHRLIKISTSGPSTIVLPQQSTRELAELLRGSDVEHSVADRYASAARRSLYRYRLVCSRLAHPHWTEELRDPAFRRLWLLGSWERGNEGSEYLLQSGLAMSVDDAARQVSRDVNSADPIFSHVGGVWHATAPLESARYFMELSDLVPGDLAVFRPLALSVLGEIDPALELPEGERWLANIKGKTRRYSKRVRVSVATTLAVLASECGSEPQPGGLTIQGFVDQLVREILDGWTEAPSMWMSLDDVLMILVEATPDVILERIRRDLLGDGENLKALAKPEKSPLSLGDFSRLTTILGALRALLWSPRHCVRAFDTVRDLARGVEEGNSSPNPVGVVREALWPTIPQSALSTTERVNAIERCVRDAPDVAKQVIEKTITESNGFVFSHGTYFRPWSEKQQRVTWADAFEVYRAMIDGAIKLADQYPELWVTLVDAADNVGPSGFDQIVCALAALPAGDPSSVLAWQAVQHQVRRHRQHHDAGWALPEAYLERLEAAVKQLEPTLARDRQEWLFGKNQFDLGLAVSDIRGEDSLLAKLQTDAVALILAEEGFEGLLELARAHPYGAQRIGQILARSDKAPGPEAITVLLKSEVRGTLNLARGFFIHAAIEGKAELLQLAESLPNEPVTQARLLLAHPDPVEAWECAEKLGEPAEDAFWAEFWIYGPRPDDAHTETAIRKLLSHGRIAMALDALSLYGKSIAADKRSALILDGLLLLANKPPSNQADFPPAYQIRELMSIIRKDPSVPRAAVCQLELALYPVFEFPDGEPLAVDVAASTMAEDFVFLVEKAYRPKSVAADDYVFDKTWAQVAFRALHRMCYTPGLDGEDINLEALAAWVARVRELAAASDRVDIAMHAIGDILGRVKAQGGQPYPHPAIVAVLEASTGDDMLGGFRTSVFNSRGIVSRDHGGQQERDLAEKYEVIAQRLQDSAPRTSEMFGQLARGYQIDGAREDEREQRIEDGIDPI